MSRYRRSPFAWVYVGVTTPNREFEVRQRVCVTLDQGQVDCGSIEWEVQRKGKSPIWRRVRHKALEEKLAQLIEDKSERVDFATAIHESMTEGAEAAWEARNDR